jgi:hypothetical protein
VRRSRRLALLTSATAALASVGVVLTSGPAAASTVFGTGTPGFVVSAANIKVPLTPVLEGDPDFSGEPSIGVNWNTGAALYMAGTNVLKVRFDPATSQVTWSDASPYFGTATNLDPILVTEPRSGTTLAGGDTGACSGLFSSTDDGGLWLPSIPCTGTIDHPTVGWSPSAVTPGSTVFYYCQQEVLDNCATSTNGGLSWLPGANVNSDCLSLHGHLKGGPDGTAYLPNVDCFDATTGDILVGGLRTEDDGLTWQTYTIPNAPMPASGFDPSVTVDAGNTLYEGWNNAGDYHPVVATSHDKGATWSPKVDLAGTVSPPLVASTFPTLVSGDAGRAAYSFLGTSVGAPGVDPFATGFHGIWYAYTAYTYDGGQTWTTVRDTPTPVQYGEIDAGGTTTSGQRNLLDFMDSSVTKDGRVVVALADGCLADCETAGAAGNQALAESRSTHAWATVAYQNTGRGLFAGYDVATPPAAPSLTATRTDSITDLSWTVPDDGGSPITGYSLLRTVGTGPESVLATTAGTTFADSTAPPGQTVSYRVAAVNAAGTGTPSNAVSVTTAGVPAAPALAAVGDLDSVSLSWSPPADNGAAITGYVLRRGTTSGSTSTLATLGAVTSYTDSAVTPGVSYYYVLQAVNSVGTGPASPEASASAYTKAAAPALTAAAGKGQVTLTWTVPNDGGRPITAYQVFRGPASGTETLVQTLSTGTTYVDPGRTGGTTYYYKVAAVTVAGTGAFSNEASATPKKGQPT